MWEELDHKLIKTFIFSDFSEAFSFMARVALLAEKLDHHPYWSNVYSQVSFELSTHDAGNRVTEKDQTLAREIDRIYLSYNSAN